MLSSCFFLYIFMWVYIEIVSCTHGYIENRCRGFFFFVFYLNITINTQFAVEDNKQ